MAGLLALVAPPTWPFWARVGAGIAQVVRGLMTQAPAAGAAAGTIGIATFPGSTPIQQAQTGAQARDQAGTTTVTCSKCSKNPCAHLAGGVPGGRFRGGAHGALGGVVGDQIESHHIPAKAVSYLHENVGPAIQMDEADHWRTASNGRMPGHAAYIARQGQHIAGNNFLGAVAMDIADIRSKFGTKYDSAIAQMEAYTACLKQNGLIR